MRRSDVMRRRDVALAFVTVSLLTLTLSASCGGVTPEQHMQNVGEGVVYQSELTRCRALGRAAKADAGGGDAGYIAYMLAYGQCAEEYDRAHAVDGGQP